MRIAKSLIRLGECWSESLLGAYVIYLVLSCCGSFFREWSEKYVFQTKYTTFSLHEMKYKPYSQQIFVFYFYIQISKHIKRTNKPSVLVFWISSILHHFDNLSIWAYWKGLNNYWKFWFLVISTQIIAVWGKNHRHTNSVYSVRSCYWRSVKTTNSRILLLRQHTSSTGF